MTESRRGLLFGLAAYGLWGAFPLYFPLLEPGGAIEILAHRIVWSALVMALLVLALRRRAALRDLLRDRRTTLLLVLAAATITVNWGTYIYGVNSERVVETSLGYFINPLVTVLMGVVILKERLRPVQWAALGIGFVAVAVLTWDYGRPPWIALVLAFSFGTYGLAKKTAGVGAIESLALETALIAPFALCFLAWLGTTGDSHFALRGRRPRAAADVGRRRHRDPAPALQRRRDPADDDVAGTVAVPRARSCSSRSASRVLGEDMPAGRWIGFALVWLALSVFTWDALRERRRQLADRLV